MTRLEKKIIEQAKLIAPSLVNNRCRHISFCTIRNKIISIGVNSYVKSNPISFKFGSWNGLVHSELNAIVNAARSIDFSKVTLYNVRVKLDGSLAISAPCLSCQKVLSAFNIRRCYFTTEQESFERFF